MNDQDIYEQFYQSWIKQHLRKILTTAGIIVFAVGVWEANNYYHARQQEKAQILFEEYLALPKDQIVDRLRAEHPDNMQTQLVLLLEAKKNFEDNDIDQTIENLSFVTKHAGDEGIQHLAAYRLAMVYRHTNRQQAAQTLIESLPNPGGYAQLQQALSLPEYSTERMESLQTALENSESNYVSQLIAIAQHDNITS